MEIKTFELATSRGIEKWNVIDSMCKYGKNYHLLENATFGDDVPCMIIDDVGNILEWNCYDGLDEWWEGR